MKENEERQLRREVGVSVREEEAGKKIVLEREEEMGEERKKDKYRRRNEKCTVRKFIINQ